MFVELEGVSEADAIVHLIGVGMHDIVIDRFDIYVGNVVGE